MGILSDDFQQRLKLFKDSGLEDQYGQYSGKEDQTTALKNYVRSGSSSSSSGGQPSINLNQIYDTAFNSPEIQSLQKEIDSKKEAVNKATTSINDNPFASEATRVGKIEKLNSTAGRDVSLIEEQLAQRKADAQVKVNIATQQYNIDSQQYQNDLSKLNLLISSGSLTNANGQDIAGIALATGLSTDMIQGIQKKMIADAVKPQVITNTDNNGKVTVSVIDANTGKVISQNSLGNIGGANTSASGSGNQYKPGTETYNKAVNLLTQDLQSVTGADKRVSPSDYNSFRQQWVQAGFSPSDFDSSFKGFVNPSYAQDYLVGLGSGSNAPVINIGR